MTTLYNVNTRSAYQAGGYDGVRAIAELLTHADFALGALDHNDGELLVLDGTAWRSAAGGVTTPVDPSISTPYATGLRFTTDTTLSVDTALPHTSLVELLAEHVTLDDRIWAIKITGRFATVTAGAGRRQEPPYRPLTEVFAEYEMHTSNDSDGTLVGFHCPDRLTGLNMVGLHFHYLSHDHTHGGHVTGWTLASGTVELCQAGSFLVDLPTGTERTP